MQFRRVLSILLAGCLSILGVLTMAGCGEARMEKRQLWVSVTVPNPGWHLKIAEVYAVDREVWVVSELTEPDESAAMVISNASDNLTVKAPSGEVKHFIVGKTWDWENDEAYTFVTDRDELPDSLQSATKLYPQD